MHVCEKCESRGISHVFEINESSDELFKGFHMTELTLGQTAQQPVSIICSLCDLVLSSDLQRFFFVVVLPLVILAPRRNPMELCARHVTSALVG